MLKQCTLPVRPETIAKSLGLSKDSIYPGLRELVDTGHVIKFGNGFYQSRKVFKTVGPTKKQIKAKRSPSHQKKIKITPKSEIEEKATESETDLLKHLQCESVFSQSAVSKPEVRKAQDELNKNMREAVDKLCEETEMPEDNKKPEITEIDPAIDAAITKLNMPVVNIPKLEDAKVKMYILKQLSEKVDDSQLSFHLEDLRVWVRDVLMLE